MMVASGLPKLKVLYADDEDDVRDVFAAVFAPDFDVRTAPTAATRSSRSRSGEFDVLVSDMRMEPHEGLGAASRAPSTRTPTCSASSSRATAITTISPTR